MTDGLPHQMFAVPLTVPAKGIWGLSLIYSPSQQRLVEISVLTKPPADSFSSPDQVIALSDTVKWLQSFFTEQTHDTTIWLKKHLSELTGTPFQLAVWGEIAKIAPGQIKTYQSIAQAIGHPGAVRAVGTACGKNPWPFLIPCHRVVATHGLGGYGFGLTLKKWLLEQEGVDLTAVS